MTEILSKGVEAPLTENPLRVLVGCEFLGIVRDAFIQPWMFGHPETKATCLWLKGLAKLVPTTGFFDRRFVKGREQRIFKEPPGPDRWKNRSRTYPKIAEAMASQWSICEGSVGSASLPDNIVKTQIEAHK